MIWKIWQRPQNKMNGMWMKEDQARRVTKQQQQQNLTNLYYKFRSIQIYVSKSIILCIMCFSL